MPKRMMGKAGGKRRPTEPVPADTAAFLIALLAAILGALLAGRRFGGDARLETLLDAAARVPHRALVDGARLAGNLRRLAPLHRMQLETDPQPAGTAEGLDFVGMNRAGPGSGIDLGLDRADPEIGECDPFAPADLDRIFGVEACFHGEGATDRASKVSIRPI